MDETSVERHRGVLITGASSGIGYVTALELDARGYRVFAGVRRTEDAERLRTAASPNLKPIRLDITDEAQRHAAVASIREQVGDRGLWGIVNNAGIVVANILELATAEDWRRQFEVNVFGHVLLTNLCLPMIRRARGRIVNIGSAAGMVAMPLNGLYSASKHALEAISDVQRLELAPWGIKVCLIQPGAIDTPIWDHALKKGEDSWDSLPDEYKQLYEEMKDKVISNYTKVAAKAIDPREVAEAVLEALSAPNPRTRYRIGRDARAAAVLSTCLPDRARDRLIQASMRLPRTPPSLEQKRQRVVFGLVVGGIAGIFLRTMLRERRLRRLAKGV